MNTPKDTQATPGDIARIRQSAEGYARYAMWLARELRRPIPHKAVMDAAAEALEELVSTTATDV